VDAVFTNPDHYTYNEDGELLQAAMVVTDASTGEIKAVAGGMGNKTGSRTYNRASALRQPGSTIKPLSVYAPAIDSGFITSATILSNKSMTFSIEGSEPWTPKNSTKAFDGKNVSVRIAVEKSLNIPAAKIIYGMGIDHSFNFLTQNLGITSLVEKQQTSSGIVSDKALAALSLGGLTNGVSPIEISAAYAPFINDGYYTKPHTYTEIYNHNGEILFKKQTDTHRAMNSETATVMTDLMSGVVSDGTGTAARFDGVDIAGKTGTTDNNKDKWFVGYTPSLVGVTWVGYDTPTEIRDYNGKALAINLWKDVMSQIDYSKRPDSFSEVLSYDNLDTYTICPASGLIAKSFCSEYEEECFEVLLIEDDAENMDVCNEEIHLVSEEPEDAENPEDSPESGEVTPDESPLEPDIPDISEEEPAVPDTPYIPPMEL